MAHSHGHGESHGHHHHGTNNKRALKWAFFLIAAYMLVEIAGGITTNSLALLSDAGHMLSDAAALGLSYLALTYGQKSSSQSKTYGYRRFEILAAFINGIALLAIALYIFWESYQRILNPPSVISKGMLIISIIGLMVNIVAAYILMKGDKDENLNVKSAFLHVLGDMLGSVGAIAAALVIMFFNWNLADPIASIIVAILVLISGWRVTKESVHILMEGTPQNVNFKEIKQALLSIPEVKQVHDLHVWSISSDFPALSCHLVADAEDHQQTLLKKANQLLMEQFHIEHTTIQIDLSDTDCTMNHSCE
ncbi:cation diffusion facilitator family transporter [Fictibacillus enclensis]|uniref:cation diffusion facilitator family transporter n=1 Tax=Fictibacillus enclensis TaxID=1017270 RepID=UPI0025A08387|nr:cation diffusion facilitator family transporter [Fictibacillus enclensis]MDM5199864.1 cation diffusion facilitator family transporter [Fictibacillus enclensis]